MTETNQEPVVEPLLTKTVQLIPKSRGAQLLNSLTFFLVALVVAMGFFFVRGNANDAAAQAMKNTHQIEQLQSQLEAQTEQIASQAALIQAQNAATEKARLAEVARINEQATETETDLTTQAGKVECVTRFTYAVQAATADVLVADAALNTVIAQTVPGADRIASIGTKVADVNNAATKYDMTIQARIDYDVAGSPLPCPLQPGATG